MNANIINIQQYQWNMIYDTKQRKLLSIPDMSESFDGYDEEELVRAFEKISNHRRASAVTIGEACRQIWRQDTR